MSESVTLRRADMDLNAGEPRLRETSISRQTTSVITTPARGSNSCDDAERQQPQVAADHDFLANEMEGRMYRGRSLTIGGAGMSEASAPQPDAA